MELRECGKGANTTVDGRELTVVVAGASGGAVDVLAFQLDASGAVRSDDDLVFYNHLESPEGAVRLTAPDTVTVDLNQVPISVGTVAIAIALADGEAGSVLPKGVGVTVRSRSDAFWAPTEGLTTERAAILVELYRRKNTWKLRNVSAGWERGLSALVAHHGVTVDGVKVDGVTVDEQPRASPTTIVDSVAAPSASTPALPLIAPPGNRSRRSADEDEAIPAAGPKTGTRKRIALLGAVVAAIALLAAIYGRFPDRSAPVTVADTGAARPPSSAAPSRAPSSSRASSSAGPDTAAAAAANSPSAEVSSTAAPQPAAEKALAPPAAVPGVRDRSGAQSAVTALEAVRVAGRAPRTGYSRAQFGQAWTDDAGRRRRSQWLRHPQRCPSS